MQLASEHSADTRPKGSEYKEPTWSISSGADSDQRNPEDGLESLLPVYVVTQTSGGLVMYQWGPKREHCSAHGSGVVDKHTSLGSLTRSSNNHVSRLSMFIGRNQISVSYDSLFFTVLDTCICKGQSHFPLAFASKTKQTKAL